MLKYSLNKRTKVTTQKNQSTIKRSKLLTSALFTAVALFIANASNAYDLHKPIVIENLVFEENTGIVVVKSEYFTSNHVMKPEGGT